MITDAISPAAFASTKATRATKLQLTGLTNDYAIALAETPGRGPVSEGRTDDVLHPVP